MAETLLLLEETSSALQEAKTLRNQALKDLDREEMRIYRILFWPWTAVFLLVSLVWPIALLVLYPSYTIGSVFSAIGIQWSIAVVALFVVRGILSKTATRWIEPTMKALFKAETNLREARKAEAERFLSKRPHESVQATSEALVAALLPEGLYWLAERYSDLYLVIDASAIHSVQIIDRMSSLDHDYKAQPPRTGEGVCYQNALGEMMTMPPAYVAPSVAETPSTPYDYVGVRVDVEVALPGHIPFWLSMPFDEKKEEAAAWAEKVRALAKPKA